ncbi:hypothetical protein RN001_016397 [Aquatica leii]|uniref:Aurora kinase n=1 Tax=Aquatica leii TaxID=1421715 RepID=A0AAN7P0C9_9COLE|nr:hypothetical protein RN001_016397 [Aquatica leii]
MAHKNVEEEVEKCLNEVEIPEEDYEESKLFLTKMLSHEAYNNENYNWSLNDFELGTRIGRGQFGRVFIAREKQTGDLVALKTLLKKEIVSNHVEQQVLREIEIQSHLKHKNILDLLSVGICWKRSSKYIYQVTSALDYCHRKKVIHRDLKPENLLLSITDDIKLGDFGWSVHAPSLHCKTRCGTVDYISPEIIEAREYGAHVDNWSLGILCYEFLVGKPPFESESDKETFVRILNVDIHYPCHVPAGAIDLISKLLRKTAEERITLSDVMQHP